MEEGVKRRKSEVRDILPLLLTCMSNFTGYTGLFRCLLGFIS